MMTVSSHFPHCSHNKLYLLPRLTFKVALLTLLGLGVVTLCETETQTDYYLKQTQHIWRARSALSVVCTDKIT